MAETITPILPFLSFLLCLFQLIAIRRLNRNHARRMLEIKALRRRVRALEARDPLKEIESELDLFREDIARDLQSAQASADAASMAAVRAHGFANDLRRANAALHK